MSGNVVRIIGAFVAGLVLALAGALVYVRIHEQQAAQQAAIQVAPEEPAPVGEPTPAQETPQQPVSAPPEERTEPPVHAKRDLSTGAAKRHAMKRSAPQHADEPVQVVQNTAPASPLAYPATSQAQQGTTPETANAPVPPSAPQPHVIQLAAGTNLVIRLNETVSTDHNYTDDAFRGTLDQPIIRDGFIIADKGSKVLGRVLESDKAGRVRGVANLRLALTEINTTDGQRIAITTNSVEKDGSKSTGRDAAKIAGGAALGALIGALGGGGKGAAIGAGAGGAAGTGLVLATRGKAAVIPSESRLTFQLTDPVTITEKLNR